MSALYLQVLPLHVRKSVFSVIFIPSNLLTADHRPANFIQLCHEISFFTYENILWELASSCN